MIKQEPVEEDIDYSFLPERTEERPKRKLDHSTTDVSEFIKEERVSAFLGDVGFSKEDMRQMVYAEGNLEMNGVSRKELMPLDIFADEDIDLDEKPTEIEIRDGISRLKLLAIKVVTYAHVVNGQSMATVFDHDAESKRKRHFHLRTQQQEK